MIKNKNKNRIKCALHGNSKGFSLVELLVCAAILGIIAVCVSFMMNSGTKYYTGMNKEVNISHRTQVAMTQIREFFIDCDALCTDENGVVYILNTDAGGNKVVYSFDWDSDEKTVEMQEYDTLLEPKGDAQPFAKMISKFSITVNNGGLADRAATVKVVIESEFDGAKYEKSQIFSLKNKPVYVNSGKNGEDIKTAFKRVIADS